LHLLLPPHLLHPLPQLFLQGVVLDALRRGEEPRQLPLLRSEQVEPGPLYHQYRIDLRPQQRLIPRARNAQLLTHSLTQPALTLSEGPARRREVLVGLAQLHNLLVGELQSCSNDLFESLTHALLELLTLQVPAGAARTWRTVWRRRLGPSIRFSSWCRRLRPGTPRRWLNRRCRRLSFKTDERRNGQRQSEREGPPWAESTLRWPAPVRAWR